jgi:hypothetical protein
MGVASQQGVISQQDPILWIQDKECNMIRTDFDLCKESLTRLPITCITKFHRQVPQHVFSKSTPKKTLGSLNEATKVLSISKYNLKFQEIPLEADT